MGAQQVLQTKSSFALGVRLDYFQMIIVTSLGVIRVRENNFSSEDRMDYTIIGGTVNLASRLEHEAPVGGILISPDTYYLVEDEVQCTAMGVVDIRGMAYPVETYNRLRPIK